MGRRCTAKAVCISNKCFAVSSFFFSCVRGSMSRLRTCASSSRFLSDFFFFGGGGGGGRGRGVSKFGFTDFHGFVNAYHACGTKHITDGHHATNFFLKSQTMHPSTSINLNPLPAPPPTNTDTQNKYTKPKRPN